MLIRGRRLFRSTFSPISIIWSPPGYSLHQIQINRPHLIVGSYHTLPIVKTPTTLNAMPLARSHDPLVWIDCEMTGLDPERDQILQVCCFITDAQLHLLNPDGFETVIHHPDSTLESMSPWCIDVHDRTGLTAAVRASTTTPTAAAESLLAYIRRFVPTPRTALLAGNSVHADKAFLARGPYAQILEHLHYRILDVSAIKEAARRWGSDELLEQVPPKREVHLARDDILESIAEMRFYKEKLFEGRGA